MKTTHVLISAIAMFVSASALAAEPSADFDGSYTGLQRSVVAMETRSPYDAPPRVIRPKVRRPHW